MTTSEIQPSIKLKKIVVAFLCACATAVSAEDGVQRPADAIWFGGPIVTIDDTHPNVEAVAVTDGKIVRAGKRTVVMQMKGPATQLMDLHGATLLPGFIDPHGHMSLVGFQALSANLLPPPDGTGISIAALQKTLTAFQQQSPVVKKFGILFGFGYDDSQLKEQRHPTRSDLDRVAPNIPALIVHQSGHLCVANSKALQLAGISAKTPNPAGGIIRRRAGSQEPNGVLEENACFGALMKVMPQLNQEQAIAMATEGQKLYTSYGYTTIQDGRATPGQVKTLMAAAEQGKLKADVVSYPDILTPGAGALMKAPWFHPTTDKPSYTNHFRIGGIKLTLDGSPQGKTAWLTKPYFKPPEGKGADYSGYGVVSDAEVTRIYKEALANRWQVLTHSNGDAASDQLIRAMRSAEKAYPGVDVRPVLVHGQVLRKDQVAALKELKIFPSLFPMHTYYWGDWHRTSVLGPERAKNISPTGWVRQAGMMFTSHHDAPVANPDSIRILSATVNRTTRSGYVLGPDQRVDPLTALKAMTQWAAYQYFEEDTKGSITPGKLADFVVLSDNPLTMPRNKLDQLKVLQTIKEGKLIYSRPEHIAVTHPNFGTQGKMSMNEVFSAAPFQGDGDFAPALEAVYERLFQ